MIATVSGLTYRGGRTRAEEPQTEERQAAYARPAPAGLGWVRPARLDTTGHGARCSAAAGGAGDCSPCGSTVRWVSLARHHELTRRTTTERGLGSEHQREKRVQKRDLSARPGLPCPRCGGPMYATPEQAAAAGLPRRLRYIDLDDFPGRIYGGVQVKLLAHRYCNRSAGARLGNRRRGLKRAAEKYNRW